MKIVARVLMAAVCVAFGFSLGRMYPADKGPAPRQPGSGATTTSGTPTARPGALPQPTGSGPSTTPIAVSPTTGPDPTGHEHASG